MSTGTEGSAVLLTPERENMLSLMYDAVNQLGGLLSDKNGKQIKGEKLPLAAVRAFVEASMINESQVAQWFGKPDRCHEDFNAFIHALQTTRLPYRDKTPEKTKKLHAAWQTFLRRMRRNDPRAAIGGKDARRVHAILETMLSQQLKHRETTAFSILNSPEAPSVAVIQRPPTPAQPRSGIMHDASQEASVVETSSSVKPADFTPEQLHILDLLRETVKENRGFDTVTPGEDLMMLGVRASLLAKMKTSGNARWNQGEDADLSVCSKDLDAFIQHMKKWVAPKEVQATWMEGEVPKSFMEKELKPWREFLRGLEYQGPRKFKYIDRETFLAVDRNLQQIEKASLLVQPDIEYSMLHTSAEVPAVDTLAQPRFAIVQIDETPPEVVVEVTSARSMQPKKAIEVALPQDDTPNLEEVSPRQVRALAKLYKSRLSPTSQTNKENRAPNKLSPARKNFVAQYDRWAKQAKEASLKEGARSSVKDNHHQKQPTRGRGNKGGGLRA